MLIIFCGLRLRQVQFFAAFSAMCNDTSISSCNGEYECVPERAAQSTEKCIVFFLFTNLRIVFVKFFVPAQLLLSYHFDTIRKHKRYDYD